jgi:hypothetical protein
VPHRVSYPPRRGYDMDVDPAFLRAYSHVARCPKCQDYARVRLNLIAAPSLLAATLAHHDDSHSRDPLTLAGQHFG